MPRGATSSKFVPTYHCVFSQHASGWLHMVAGMLTATRVTPYRERLKTAHTLPLTRERHIPNALMHKCLWLKKSVLLGICPLPVLLRQNRAEMPKNVMGRSALDSVAEILSCCCAMTAVQAKTSCTSARAVAE